MRTSATDGCTLRQSTNPFIAERVAEDCLLLPDSRADLDLTDKLADMAMTTGSGTDGLPYFQACKAMSLYRRRRFSEAITWSERAASSSAAFAQAKGYAVLAMARWQLGQHDEAHSALTKGDALAPLILFQKDAEDLGGSWVAWLMARISLDEAAALMQTADGGSTER